MSALIQSPHLDIDEDDEDDDFLDDFDWEDNVAFERYRNELPPGWVILKIEGYTSARMIEIKEWAEVHCEDAWDTVGWSTGCSYSVAIKFASKIDASFYRLRF